MDEQSVEAEIAALWVNSRQQAQRIRYLEKLADTHLETPLWKRILFALDGWRVYGLQQHPQWRPWRRWYRS